MANKKEMLKGIKKINIEEPTCCQHAERFWEEIDGIVDNIDSYDKEKRQNRLDELSDAFGTEIE